MAEFFKISNPFEDLTPDQIKDVFISIGEDASNKFHEYLSTISELLTEIEPFYLLSVLTFYGLSDKIDNDGKRLRSETKIEQSYVELTQALLIKLFSNEEDHLCRPETIQKIIDILPEINRSFFNKRMLSIKNADSKEQRAILALQEKVRVHTQVVRNWGYHQSVLAICKAIFSELDDIFIKSCGITALQLIDLFEFWVDNLEIKLEDYFKKLKNVFKENTIDSLTSTYYSEFQLPLSDLTNLQNYLKSLSISIEECKGLIYSHSQLFVIDHLQLDFNSIELEKFPINDYKKVLSMVSYNLGDLKEYENEHIFLSNPVWNRPLIKRSEHIYFCCFPQMFFSHIFNIFDNICWENSQFLEKISKRKSDYLENAIAMLFEKSFPGAKIFPNYKWEESKDLVYETDLLLTFDTYLLIIEAKSGKISNEALRGAPDRLKREIKNILIEPAIQSQRLYNRILNDNIPDDFPLDLSKIYNILRISISLEDFATIQTNISFINDTGWFDTNIDLPPTFCLSDLEVVFGILSSSTKRLHYLIRRSELEKNKKYMGCEMDLLGTYLETSFDFGDLEFNGEPLNVIEMSKAIDDYYLLNYKDKNVQKPVQKMTKWWEDIINKIEERSFEGSTDIAIALLNYSYEKQVDAIKQFEIVKNNCFLFNGNDECQNSIIFTPNSESNIAIAFMAYRNNQESIRHNLSDNIKNRAFNISEKISKVIVFGFNVDILQSYPYKFVKLFVSKRGEI